MAFEADRQRFGVVAAAPADFAHHVDVGQKIHFDAAQAVALAGFAAAAFYVEAEAPGTVAALRAIPEAWRTVRGSARRRRCRWRGSNAACGRSEPGRSRSPCRSARRPASSRCAPGVFLRAVKFLRQRTVQDVVDERGLAGAGNAGDHGEQPKRQGDVDILQVVGVRAEDLDGFAVGAAAMLGNGNARRAAEISSGERLGRWRRFARVCLARPDSRQRRRRPGRDRPRNRRGEWCLRRARRPGRCCRDCEAARANRAGGRCRARASPMEGSSRT